MGSEFRYNNEYSNDYSYDTYRGSGEVGSSESSDSGIDLNQTNDFTNNEIRNSLDGNSTDYGKDIGIDLNDQSGEQLEPILENFDDSKWADLTLDEQKQSITDLADYVAVDTGNDNPPQISFRDDMADGSYGGYNPETNTIEINENMLDDAMEAADTIAHEMWHAHQQQAADDPSNPRASEYQEGFDNYISPEYDFEGYENQMVESEARDYAQGFKDRLAGLKGA
ncbi:MAG: hypothetical protein LBC96_02725 [Lachnospiraceae bacterium]|jgi:hypothetical protein|nr:hypothetical protein [Lachnospiraceae bacterium]